MIPLRSCMLKRGSECEAALSVVTMCAQWAARWSRILAAVEEARGERHRIRRHTHRVRHGAVAEKRALCVGNSDMTTAEGYG